MTAINTGVFVRRISKALVLRPGQDVAQLYHLVNNQDVIISFLLFVRCVSKTSQPLYSWQLTCSLIEAIYGKRKLIDSTRM